MATGVCSSTLPMPNFSDGAPAAHVFVVSGVLELEPDDQQAGADGEALGRAVGGVVLTPMKHA